MRADCQNQSQVNQKNRQKKVFYSQEHYTRESVRDWKANDPWQGSQFLSWCWRSQENESLLLVTLDALMTVLELSQMQFMREEQMSPSGINGCVIKAWQRENIWQVQVVFPPYTYLMRSYTEGVMTKINARFSAVPVPTSVLPSHYVLYRPECNIDEVNE